MRSMLTRVPMQTGYGAVVHVEVSVPYVDVLVADGDGKYYVKPMHIEDDTERRRHRHRGPTLRSLVKLALACDSAEQMGKQLRARFQRNARRAGIAARQPHDAELNEGLDRLMAEPGA